MSESTARKAKTAVSILAAVLLVILYFIIWGFSAQDGESSGSLSAMISEKCVEIIDVITARHWTDAMRASMAAYFEHPIRKLAHFSEYACMGILLFGIWRPWKAGNYRWYAGTVLWVFLSAALDEFHQLFIPGRYGCFADVCLDTCGGATGLLVAVWILHCIIKRRTRSGLKDKAS